MSISVNVSDILILVWFALFSFLIYIGGLKIILPAIAKSNFIKPYLKPTEERDRALNQLKGAIRFHKFFMFLVIFFGFLVVADSESFLLILTKMILGLLLVLLAITSYFILLSSIIKIKGDHK